jgi:hypothetical protein
MEDIPNLKRRRCKMETTKNQITFDKRNEVT